MMWNITMGQSDAGIKVAFWYIYLLFPGLSTASHGLLQRMEIARLSKPHLLRKTV